MAGGYTLSGHEFQWSHNVGGIGIIESLIFLAVYKISSRVGMKLTIFERESRWWKVKYINSDVFVSLISLGAIF